MAIDPPGAGGDRSDRRDAVRRRVPGRDPRSALKHANAGRLAFADIAGEFIAQGTPIITITVSFVVALVIAAVGLAALWQPT